MEREGEEDLRGVVRREILIRICKGKIEKPSSSHKYENPKDLGFK